jgi:hypothetical protein
MAVIQSSIARVNPGRFDDFLEMSREAIKLHERLGVDARLLIATVAGEATGLTVFSTEHANLDEYGEYAESAAADSELQSLVTRSRGADSPVSNEQVSLASELPLGRTPRAGRGSVVEIHVTRPTPGRMEEVVALATRVCDFVEANGASNARTFQLGYAGSGTGMLMSSWEYETVRAWTGAADAWNSDPEGQEIAASSLVADPSSTLVFSGVYSEIPI